MSVSACQIWGFIGVQLVVSSLAVGRGLQAHVLLLVVISFGISNPVKNHGTGRRSWGFRTTNAAAAATVILRMHRYT
jgi:hypothetical protein